MLMMFKRRSFPLFVVALGMAACDPAASDPPARQDGGAGAGAAGAGGSAGQGGGSAGQGGSAGGSGMSCTDLNLALSDARTEARACSTQVRNQCLGTVKDPCNCDLLVNDPRSQEALHYSQLVAQFHASHCVSVCGRCKEPVGTPTCVAGSGVVGQGTCGYRLPTP